ncbi:hypothetical protein ACTFIZ_001890 [Dictyostelium cf. discoideum]
MLNPNKIIKEGDRVIIYNGKDNMAVLTMESSNIYNNKFGSYRHKNIIGKEYGSKLTSDNGNGFCHVIAMTPELWSITLNHRTQILFNLDISTIIFNLELKNGSRAVESGTGSGSLSSSIARTIAPKGHLFTFEFHEERVKFAREDFQNNGLDKYITVTHRDACGKEGFLRQDINNDIDAVFLDLPSPWDAIENAMAVMHDGSMLCSFSPCIEQVQNTCLKLADSKFQEIKTIEVLIRTFDTRLQEYEELNLTNPYIDNNEENNNNNNNNKGKFEIGGIEGFKKDKLLSKPFTEARGHTGYLTFARYLPNA